MRIPKRWRHVCLFLLAGLLAVGCGGPGKPVKVEGVVTLDDKPLPGATVTFVPKDKGRSASGLTESDGSFRLTTFRTEDGALPGEYKVIIVVPEPLEKGVEGRNPETVSDEQKYADRMTMIPKARKAAHKKKSSSPVPAIYGDAGQTPLREVVPPDGKVVLPLRTKH